MPDLSAYVNFSTVLDKSQSMPAWKFIDTSNYPAGVAQTVTGYFNITQPDGVTITGSFTSPTVYWNTGALVQPSYELRLSTANTFQNGGYTMVYYVRAPGYDDTVLTKTISLQYTAPILVLTQNFNIFTPSLTVLDATTYGQSALTYSSTIWSWSADINTVVGVGQTITGSAQTFDLAYLGSYYDSQYVVTLITTPQYIVPGSNPFATVIDKLETTATYYASIPPSELVLLEDLNTLKSQMDAAICDCILYPILKDRYLMAEAIYMHMRVRGCEGLIDGLDVYVYQLQKLFNNNVVPSYTNTNAIIPAYTWDGCGGGSGGSTAWTDITGKPATTIVEWTVGAGGFPGAGATSYTDARMVGFLVRMFRTGLAQSSVNPGTGNTFFTKANLAANSITFSPLGLGEEIRIETIPL